MLMEWYTAIFDATLQEWIWIDAGNSHPKFFTPKSQRSEGGFRALLNEEEWRQYLTFTGTAKSTIFSAMRASITHKPAACYLISYLPTILRLLSQAVRLVSHAIRNLLLVPLSVESSILKMCSLSKRLPLDNAWTWLPSNFSQQTYFECPKAS